ncbi:Sodium/hydrogen exchanger 2 [Platanthera guangdongensis]|uniref:Sodium/hydrogen exchanger 2 n=1 Tax=Platanthera guangdongensis TaxID=2320717 RepID=A0ABR2MPY0_9ASPA
MSLNPETLVLSSKLAVQSDYASVVSITLFVGLLCACIVIGHLLEGNRWINESITALFLGLVTGVVILLTTKGRARGFWSSARIYSSYICSHRSYLMLGSR